MSRQEERVSERGGIRRRLVRRTLTVAVLPVLVVGVAAVGLVHDVSERTDRRIAESEDRLAADVVATELQQDAEALLAEIEGFVGERVGEARLLAAVPDVIDAARDGPLAVSEDGLAEALEERFAATRSLGVAPDVDRFLRQQVAASDVLAAVMVTDADGRVVAASRRAESLMHRNEDWWRRAYQTGLDLSTVRFDADTGRFSIAVAVAIEDPGRGGAIGVLRSSLDVSTVQALADELAVHSGGEVTIVDPHGLLLAETRSGHDPGRIMNPALVLDGADDEALLQVLVSGDAAGNATVDDLVVGYARSTDSPVGSALGVTVVAAIDDQVALAPLAGLAELRGENDRTSRSLAMVLAGLVAAAVVAAIVLARVLARRIVGPLRRLRASADRVASEDLPRLVAAAANGHPPTWPAPIEMTTGDEVEDLAEAFNSVQATAARLAVEQAEARRRSVAHALVSMGRRNQELILRQLQFIDELEQEESNPATLANLFRLDHLATRMRRNAENLLVLAGEEPQPRRGDQVRIVDVVRSAASEIEDDRRVEVVTMDEAALAGAVVAEISHLLAELIDNALAFSPPHSTVHVAGRLVPQGYELAIVDRGPGMGGEQLSTANGMLAGSANADTAPGEHLGLVVVARLAARHGVAVQLQDAPGGGVLARVLLPSLLVEPTRPELRTPLGSATLPREPEPAAPSPERRADSGYRSASTPEIHALLDRQGVAP